MARRTVVRILRVVCLIIMVTPHTLLSLPFSASLLLGMVHLSSATAAPALESILYEEDFEGLNTGTPTYARWTGGPVGTPHFRSKLAGQTST